MFGHRRTFAAIEADLLTVPADASQIERMSTEHAENAHRAALTDSEQLGVVEQPSAPGLPSGQISKRTKIKRDPRQHRSIGCEGEVSIRHSSDSAPIAQRMRQHNRSSTGSLPPASKSSTGRAGWIPPRHSLASVIVTNRSRRRGSACEVQSRRSPMRRPLRLSTTSAGSDSGVSR